MDPTTREVEVNPIMYVESDSWLVGAKQYNFPLQQNNREDWSLLSDFDLSEILEKDHYIKIEREEYSHQPLQGYE